MTRYDVDLEAVKGLRQALVTYAGRQADALDAAEGEIAYTRAALGEAERYWRWLIFQRRAALEECLMQAACAAQQGGWVDCSACQYALAEAEEGLARIAAWQERVEEAAAAYTGAASRSAGALTDDVPRATSYLANRIAALEAYQAARNLSAVVALAGSGVPALVGAVIGAIRRCTGEVNRVLGSTGEEVAAQVLSEHFGLQEVPFDRPHQGFDRVFRAPGLPLIVVEAKISGSGQLRLGETRAGQQGSPDWVASVAARMADRDSAQWSPANERIAQLIQNLGAGNVPVVAVVSHPSANTADVYARQGGSDWRLIQSGIDVSPLPRPPAGG